MAKTLVAHEQPIAKIFSDDYVFRIPGYQRPYAWTTEQAQELLDCWREGRVPQVNRDGKVVPRAYWEWAAVESLRPMAEDKWRSGKFMDISRRAISGGGSFLRQ